MLIFLIAAIIVFFLLMVVVGHSERYSGLALWIIASIPVGAFVYGLIVER